MRRMATHLEVFPVESYPTSVETVDVGGQEITALFLPVKGEGEKIGSIPHAVIPKDVSLLLPAEYPITNVSLPENKLDWDTLTAMLRVATKLNLPETVSMHIDNTGKTPQVSISDPTALFLVQSFYEMHGGQMGIVENSNSHAVSITRSAPVGHNPMTGPLFGYEVIPPGTTFVLSEPQVEMVSA